MITGIRIRPKSISPLLVGSIATLLSTLPSIPAADESVLQHV